MRKISDEEREKNKKIGLKIREVRKSKGLSQLELAELMGYKSRSTIADIELGNHPIQKNDVLKMSNILGVSAIDLLGFEKSKVIENIMEKHLVQVGVTEKSPIDKYIEEIAKYVSENNITKEQLQDMFDYLKFKTQK